MSIFFHFNIIFHELHNNNIELYIFYCIEIAKMNIFKEISCQKIVVSEYICRFVTCKKTLIG